MIKSLLLAFVIATMASAVAGAEPVRCRMAPARLRLVFSERGVIWLEGEESQGSCAKVPRREWVRRSSGASDLFVHTDGPNGSGRFWTVTVGIGGKRQTAPTRGVCLVTSTLGWRTLQRFGRPLTWVDDGDGDERAELVLWSSFGLGDDTPAGEAALVGWVYELDPSGMLVIDWNLSRRLAREVAVAYRTTLDQARAGLQATRVKAAEALDEFADEKCRPSEEATR